MELLLATLLWGTLNNTYNTLGEIKSAQDSYYSIHKNYSPTLPKKLPPNMRIDTYKTPKGELGYQIIYNTPTRVISLSEGVEDRTFIINKTVGTASTTNK